MIDVPRFAQIPAQLLGLEPWSFGLIVIPLMAAAFCGKMFTEIILSMLFTGDIFAIAMPTGRVFAACCPVATDLPGHSGRP